MLLIIFILIFLVCWILLLTRSFMDSRNRSRLRSMASDILPDAVRTIDSGILMPFSLFRKLSLSLLCLMITFGSKRFTREYIDNFYDISVIEASGHPELNHLLQKSIQNNARYFRIWVIMVLSLIAAVASWSG